MQAAGSNGNHTSSLAPNELVSQTNSLCNEPSQNMETIKSHPKGHFKWLRSAFGVMLAAPPGADHARAPLNRAGDVPPPAKRARRDASAPARDLVHWFVRRLGRGQLSCTSIADASAGAVLAGASDPTRTLERLSQLKRRDAEAGLLKTLDEQALQLNITLDLHLFWADVPYLRDNHTTEVVLHPMYLPHELMHAVASAGLVSPVLLPDQPVRDRPCSHLHERLGLFGTVSRRLIGFSGTLAASTICSPWCR